MSGEFTKYREQAAYYWRELSRHPIYGWRYTRSRIGWVVQQCDTSTTVLEIGCGDGVLLGRLAKAGKVAIGIDSDEMALRLARGLFHRHRLRGESYCDLRPVKEIRFDTVVLAEVIEHLEAHEELLAGVIRLILETGRPSPHNAHQALGAPTGCALRPRLLPMS